MKVIESGKLVPKKRGITLRMLLSHTGSCSRTSLGIWERWLICALAGFGYSFFNERLNDFYGATGLDEISGNSYDYLSQPLVNQPGERWEYGINIDW